MHENYIVHDIIKLSLILTSDLECWVFFINIIIFILRKINKKSLCLN